MIDADALPPSRAFSPVYEKAKRRANSDFPFGHWRLDRSAAATRDGLVPPAIESAGAPQVGVRTTHELGSLAPLDYPLPILKGRMSARRELQTDEVRWARVQ
jgi:hypothetical protein